MLLGSGKKRDVSCRVVSLTSLLCVISLWAFIVRIMQALTLFTALDALCNNTNFDFFYNGVEKSALNENGSSGLTPVQVVFPEHLELRTRK